MRQRRRLPLPCLPEHPDRIRTTARSTSAQAVQLIAYEWRQALGGFAVRGAHADAGAGRRGGGARACSAHWQQALVQIGFLDPAAPKKLMPRLQPAAQPRAADPEEMHILRGIAKAHGRCGAEARIARRDDTGPRLRGPYSHSKHPMFDAPARRHRLHPRARPGRALDVGGADLLSGPACASCCTAWRTGAGGHGLKWLGALRLAPRALVHRHRDPPRRDDRPARVHRPRHGRRGRRDRRDRRRLHHLPGRDARRHLALQGRQAPPDARAAA